MALNEEADADQQDAHDEPRHRVEMLSATDCRCRVPAGGARPSALYVGHDERNQPCSSKQTRPRLSPALAPHHHRPGKDGGKQHDRTKRDSERRGE